MAPGMLGMGGIKCGEERDLQNVTAAFVGHHFPSRCEAEVSGVDGSTQQNVREDPDHQGRTGRPENCANPVRLHKLQMNLRVEGLGQLIVHRHLQEKGRSPDQPHQHATNDQDGLLPLQWLPRQPGGRKQFDCHQWQHDGSDVATMQQFVLNKKLLTYPTHQRILHQLNQPDQTCHGKCAENAGQQDDDVAHILTLLNAISGQIPES